MPHTSTAATRSNNAPLPRYDAIIVGAGVNGMMQLIRLRELGLAVRLFEAGDNVGGTWYWNRYPGCRFDSESYTYIFSFSQQLLDEWNWSEHFSAQPETLRYCNFLADKFGLRTDIEFGRRVRSATFDETNDEWVVTTVDGHVARARYLVTALGPLSAPVMPTIAGMDSFTGAAYHTGLWPHDAVEFAGKRVAVIGTGASGVQLIQTIASQVEHLTVFQRRPNWCAPLHNAPIDAAEMAEIRARYPDIFAKCHASEGGFMHVADPRKTAEVDAAEREAFFEMRYQEKGFAIWLANFYDTFTDEKANGILTEFIERKIRARLTDPAIADQLIPVDHGFGTRRVPMETGYYEVYNRANVELVSLLETPIDCITPTGLRVAGRDFAVDMIIYATGFDAMLGSYNRMDIRGVGKRSLKDTWEQQLRTYLGVQMAGFPNLMMVIGPHTGASFCNMPRCGEENVDFVTNLIRYTQEHGYTRVVPNAEAEAAWTAHVHQMADKLLITKTDSWFTGINRNLAGRQQRQVLLYAGGASRYRKRCAEVINDGYAGFEFS